MAGETIFILNLRQVEKGLDDFSEKQVPGAVKSEHKRIAMAILQGCVMGTPVDTGTARGGWDVVERPSSRLPSRGPDKAGAATVADGRRVIINILDGRKTDYSVLYVQNNVHYIGVLENTPHSAQNTGWVKATIAAVQAGLG